MTGRGQKVRSGMGVPWRLSGRQEDWNTRLQRGTWPYQCRLTSATGNGFICCASGGQAGTQQWLSILLLLPLPNGRRKSRPFAFVHLI